MKINISGQTVLEFILGALPLVAVLTGGVMVFHAEWNRLKCARLVFDAAHDALTGKTRIEARYEVDSNNDHVSVSSQCGAAHEKVELYTLESGRW